MNAFQILDKDGIAIPLSILDKEVCDLKGIEPDPKWYCDLEASAMSSWYDTIGWLIASENKSFEDIIEYFTEPMRKYIGQVDNGKVITLETIYPIRIKLLNMWIEKGYTPKQIIN